MLLLLLAACALEPTPEGPATTPATARFPNPDEDQHIVVSDAQAYDGLGTSVAGVGDVDDDGYDDVLVGAAGRNGGQGTAYFFYGSATGLDTSVELVLSYGGSDDEALYGNEVAGAGDLDGDGYDDVIIGAWRDQSTRGAAWVFYGSVTGIVFGSRTEVTAADGTTFDYFGSAVSSAGDMDGDGYDDVAIGAPGSDDGGTNAGAVHLFHGSADGIDPDSEALLVETVSTNDHQAGSAISGAGDVDGDGYDDLVVGSPGRSGGTGAVLVYHGSADGLEDAEAHVVVPLSSDVAAIGVSVAGLGDVDDDGFDDIVVGAWQSDLGATNAGAALVYLGSSDSIDPTTESLLVNPTAAEDDHFGYAVAGPGDLDDDGYDDILIGCPNDRDEAGALFVFHGGPNTPGTHGMTQLAASDGQDGDHLGFSVAAAGDIDGDKALDIVAGAPEDDQGETDAGGIYVWLGCLDFDEDGICSVDDCDDGDPDIDDTTAWTWEDLDGDGFGDDETGAWRCLEAEGVSDTDGDCDDTDGAVHPDAEEQPGDELDQDCDGKELCYADLDGDGLSDGRIVPSDDTLCDGEGETTQLGDCDDTDATIQPGVNDTCGDGVDQDCDGIGGPDGDEDGDGLSWNQESRLGTDDCAEDTDGDGLSDGDELELGTDPTKVDTDGDGLSDADDPNPLVPELNEGDIETSGCATVSAPAGLAWLLALGLGATRRRRRSALP